MFRIICLFCACLLFAGPVLAGDLTRGDIQGFLRALEELKVAGQSFEADMNARAEQKPLDPERPFARLVEIMEEVGFDEADEIAEHNGFEDTEQWGETGDRVMAAWRANIMRQSLPAMNDQIKQMLTTMEQNPNITPAQRDEIMQQLEAAGQLSGTSVEPPSADELLVQEFHGDIEAAFR